jgi:hypothetical protein
MTYTKATIGDVESARHEAVRTGALASDTGARATEGATHLQAGIDQVSDALRAHFHRLADAMRQEVRAASDQLGAADWEGASRDAAVAAEASLQGALAATLDQAEVGTERLRTIMAAEAGALVETVRGRFGAVLQRIDGAFQELAGAEAAFVAALQDADGSVRIDI